MRAGAPGADRDHRILPSAALRHSSRRSSGAADCTKTRSPQTTGDELPAPGRAVFQSTFFWVHSTGTSLSSAAPVPLGPRKRGQLEAEAAAAQHAAAHRPRNVHPLILPGCIIVVPCVVWREVDRAKPARTEAIIAQP